MGMKTKKRARKNKAKGGWTVSKKKITGPFEDEKQQVEWQKEALREDIEDEKDLRRRVFFGPIRHRPGRVYE